MAKKHYKAPKHSTGRVITTKTPFGSDPTMVVDHSNFDIVISNGQVLCKDDDGYYVTYSSRVGTGLADPNRYGVPASRVEVKEKTVQGVDNA